MGFVYPIGGKTYGNEQNKVTKNGTLKSTTNPWKIETTTKLSPAVLVIIGRVVSIVVAPPLYISIPGKAQIKEIVRKYYLGEKK